MKGNFYLQILISVLIFLASGCSTDDEAVATSIAQAEEAATRVAAIATWVAGGGDLPELEFDVEEIMTLVAEEFGSLSNGGLTVGGRAIISNTGGQGLRCRENPDTNSAIITKLEDGTEVVIVDGPVSQEDYIWWKVEPPNQAPCWAASNWLLPLVTPFPLPLPPPAPPAPITPTPTPADGAYAYGSTTSTENSYVYILHSDTQVSFREGPGEENPSKGNVIGGNYYERIERDGEWIHIRSTNLGEGWVNCQSINLGEPVSAYTDESRGGKVLEIPLVPLPPVFEIYFEERLVPDTNKGVKHDGYAGESTETHIWLGVSNRWAAWPPSNWNWDEDDHRWSFRYPC